MAILEGKFIKNVGQVATLQMTQKWFLWLTRHHKGLTWEAQPQTQTPNLLAAQTQLVPE